MEPYKIYDFEDEKAWLKGRLNGIGGSDASAVVGKNPYKTNIELFEEKTGRRIAPDISETEAQVDIVVVDLFEQKTSETTCTARKRTWSVIPDTEGDGTDALIYKGSFKAAGEITKGTATTTDGWKTCTFTAGGE